VLVIGGTGMLGHKVWQVFHGRFDALVTVRSADLDRFDGFFDPDRLIADVRVDAPDTLARAFQRARPDVVVNCVGIVKQLRTAAEAIPSITVNSLHPHRAAALAQEFGARMIHISTDCVFSGRRGGYREQDLPDPPDLYGRSKLLGEIAGPGRLTLRTSIIGRELAATTGLAEWFLSNRGGRVKGYTQAFFSGATTLALARLLADVIDRHPALEGVYHVASERISKYDVLRKLNQLYAAGVEIESADEPRIDRTLDGSAFTAATGLRLPEWDHMLAEMAADATPYDHWRKARV
jgi:dTDP-4-dehydrorhamnose reductase